MTLRIEECSRYLETDVGTPGGSGSDHSLDQLVVSDTEVRPSTLSRRTNFEEALGRQCLRDVRVPNVSH